MRSVSGSSKDYARGITGGLLFSLPLLYTMEVWWAGFNAPPFHLVLLMIVTFLVLLGYNRFAGMHPGTSLKEIVMDSFEEMGLGFVIAFLVLLLLNRINFDMDHSELISKLVIEAMFVAIGVSVGRAQLGDQNKNQKEDTNNNNNKLALIILSICGCIIVAGNVAPTEEVVLLAFESSATHMLFLVILTLIIGAVILFFSDFKKSRKISRDNMIYIITMDTALVYSTALITSTLILLFFGRFEGNYWQINLFQVIVLGFPAMLGASAGRLLIK